MTRIFIALFFSLYMFLFLGYVLLSINFLKMRNKRSVLTIIFMVLSFLGSYLFLSYIKRYDYGLEIPSYMVMFGRHYIAFPVLFILIFHFIYFILKYRNRILNVSEHSIYSGINTLKSGFCVFKENGRMMMVNEKMDELSYLATEEYLYDGLKFMSFIRDHEKNNEIEIGGFYYSCLIRDITIEDETVTEIILTDITDEHYLGEKLKDETRRRYEYQEKLRKYSEDMKEIIRTEEILDAKTKVHAEFGNLLLEGKYSLTHEEERKSFLRNAGKIMELSLTHDEKKGNSLEELHDIARSIGISLHLNGEIEERHMPAVYRLLQECITNCKKHGNAENLYLDVIRNDLKTEYVVYNDGESPKGEITEGGGLSAIRNTAEKLGGLLQYEYDDAFKIILFFGKK